MSAPAPLLAALRSAPRVLFAHAHPDDEALATGALILDLVEHGVEVQVVTATRGERGEVVPGSLPAGFTGDLEEHRAAELRQALDRLGVARHQFLGASSGRTYRDSGMRWVREGLAGPALDVEDDAFSLASIGTAADDLGAVIEVWAPGVVVSYDEGGGYGHPDHVHLHHVARLAAGRCAVPFISIATGRENADEWHDLPQFLPRLGSVLDSYRSQLTVDGDEVVHVGGQRHPIETWFGLCAP